MKNYWAEYYKKLDACKTQTECDALMDSEYYKEEQKLYVENTKNKRTEEFHKWILRHKGKA